MVNYASATNLDLIFSSLSDPIRRDIIDRLSQNELTVSEIAEAYDISLPAVSKHLSVLQRANLVFKQKQGKEQIVSLAPQTLREATDYLIYYRSYWETQLDSLESFLTREGN